MAKIKITTTQNIDIEYNVASVGERILAWLLDFAIIVIGFIILNMILSSISYGSSAMTMIAAIPSLIYHLVMEIIFQGRSVGKMVLGLKVVKLDGTPPGIGDYFIRWLFRVLETFPLIYGAPAIITAAINGQGQRIGDIVANTAVIKTRVTESLADTILRKTDPNYQVTYPQATLLTDADIRAVVDAIAAARRRRDNKIMNMVGNRVATAINARPHTKNPLEFLDTVVKDYNHLT